jgi:hypothetical protein
MTEPSSRSITHERRARGWAALFAALVAGACQPVDGNAEATAGTDMGADSSETGEGTPCTHLYFDEPEEQQSLYASAQGLELVDLDGDTLLDAAVPVDEGGDSSVRLLRNRGVRDPNSGIFDHTPNLLDVAALSGVATADWSGDGLADIIAASGPVTVFRNGSSPGKFELEETDSDQTDLGAPQGVALVDMDLDGDLETVVWSAFGVTIWPGPNPSGELGTPFSNEMEPGHGTVIRGVVEDLDGDGFPDVVVGATQKSTFLLVYRNDGTGTVLPAETYPGEFSGLEADVVDLDDDGAKDVVVAGVGSEADGFPITGPAYLAWMRNLGDGTLEQADVVELSPGWNAWSIAHADLDDDGRPELLVMTGGDLVGGTDTGGLHVLEVEDGKLVAKPPGFVEHAPNWAFMDLADVDEDGLLDIVTASGSVSILWGCR